MYVPEGRCAGPALSSSGDALLDDRVPAVVGLSLSQRQIAVGDEPVIVPGGKQRQLRAGRRPDPATD
jgi:hypothetical protein